VFYIVRLTKGVKIMKQIIKEKEIKEKTDADTNSDEI
jgi:hypothetical protein